MVVVKFLLCIWYNVNVFVEEVYTGTVGAVRTTSECTGRGPGS